MGTPIQKDYFVHLQYCYSAPRYKRIEGLGPISLLKVKVNILNIRVNKANVCPPIFSKIILTREDIIPVLILGKPWNYWGLQYGNFYSGCIKLHWIPIIIGNDHKLLSTQTQWLNMFLNSIILEIGGLFY